MFFRSVKQLEETYENANAHETLIVKLKDVSMIDLSRAYALEDLGGEGEVNNTVYFQ
jgi:MFS superfamily sulfate permease-like transporter